MKTPHEMDPATGRSEPTADIPVAARVNRESPAICGRCHSDQYLVYEEVKPVPRQGTNPPQWDVECWCGQCEEYQGFRTTTPPAMPHRILLHGDGAEAWSMGT
ncbi:hypothetical protein [Paeniglutamicibacter psychrophenolicus]|uniref:hypothetical protein n=1 Tax=Paeniglutamicibacter psychrophenolicus TaxID=257454 RepID=UPI0027810324|nr:hypothetical protein [Paeniglutamicibacter psychrophenolicus]MDQ0095998.1 hypothetical protein [Paeniglutamicibacter psychrophenolicus]